MRLLVAVSRKPYAATSLEVLARLAGPDEVRLLHVAERAQPAGGTAKSTRGASLRLEPGSPMLAEMQAELAARGVQASLDVRQGDAASAILKAAREGDVDLVVARAHDRAPGLLRRVFGDTVTRLVERCDRPVLALRAGEAAQGRGILLASGRPGVDLLDNAAAAAKATRSPVTVLHVVPTAGHEDFFQDLFVRPGDAAEDGAPKHVLSLEKAVEALRRRGVEAQARVREGIVEEQLAREANDGDHWLLVVRGRSTGRLFRLFLGHSFTEDLVRHVRTSILVVK
jgi:nucleotide-binding universal stress UspA family protein